MTKLVDFDVAKLLFQVTKLPPMEDIRPQVTEATNKEVIYLNYLRIMTLIMTLVKKYLERGLKINDLRFSAIFDLPSMSRRFLPYNVRYLGGFYGPPYLP